MSSETRNIAKREIARGLFEDSLIRLRACSDEWIDDEPVVEKADVARLQAKMLDMEGTTTLSRER